MCVLISKSTFLNTKFSLTLKIIFSSIVLGVVLHTIKDYGYFVNVESNQITYISQIPLLLFYISYFLKKEHKDSIQYLKLIIILICFSNIGLYLFNFDTNIFNKTSCIYLSIHVIFILYKRAYSFKENEIPSFDVNKNLKGFLFPTLIVVSTAMLTISFSIIGTNFTDSSKKYRIDLTDTYQVLKKTCDCSSIELSTGIKQTTSNQFLQKHVYILRDCKHPDTEKKSKKVLEELLKKDLCSNLNIEVILYDNQNNITSFKINNCNLSLNE